VFDAMMADAEVHSAPVLSETNWQSYENFTKVLRRSAKLSVRTEIATTMQTIVFTWIQP